MEWKCRRNPSVNYFVRECVIARIWLLFGFVSSSFFVSRFHWVIEMQQAGCLLCLFFFSCFISVVLFHSIWISASHMCCICVCCVHAVWLINFKSTRNNQHSLPTTATTTKLTSQHHERTLLLLLHIEYLLSHVCCSSVFHLSLALTHAHTHSLTHSFVWFVAPFGRVLCHGMCYDNNSMCSCLSRYCIYAIQPKIQCVINGKEQERFDNSTRFVERFFVGLLVFVVVVAFLLLSICIWFFPC